MRPFYAGKGSTPYEAKKFFESYYQMLTAQESDDRLTISPDCHPSLGRYHYNAVENSILEYFFLNSFPQQPNILDVGCGTGHWIDFYRKNFAARSLTGIDVSKRCVETLQVKYGHLKDVLILEGDITDPLKLNSTFDIVNAIGVLFHIPDDTSLKRAVHNLAALMAENAVLIVSGQFGFLTRNVQFHSRDHFSDQEEFNQIRSKGKLVNKRIRSLGFWRACAKETGLSIRALIKTRQHPRILTPENNILVLSKRHATGGDSKKEKNNRHEEDHIRLCDPAPK